MDSNEVLSPTLSSLPSRKHGASEGPASPNADSTREGGRRGGMASEAFGHRCGWRHLPQPIPRRRWVSGQVDIWEACVRSFLTPLPTRSHPWEALQKAHFHFPPPAGSPRFRQICLPAPCPGPICVISSAGPSEALRPPPCLGIPCHAGSTQTPLPGLSLLCLCLVRDHPFLWPWGGALNTQTCHVSSVEGKDKDRAAPSWLLPPPLPLCQ